MKAPLLLALLLLAAPATLAHDPPGPVTTCQPGWGEGYHDYLPPATGRLVVGADGNLASCRESNLLVPPILDDNGTLCQFIKSEPLLEDLSPLCWGLDTGVGQPVADYDGEWDHGYGGVYLAVETGDGATSGSLVCYGMVGHHTSLIYAQEWPTGNGPRFTVTADNSLDPPEPGPKGPRPDCGDGIVMTCESPPPPHEGPFPANVVLDVVNQLLWQVTEGGCLWTDCVDTVHFVVGYPSHTATTCLPGIDGVYVVFIESDLDPMMGHVWTDFAVPPGWSLDLWWYKGPGWKAER